MRQDRGPVTDEPEMAERVEEASLAVHAPWHLVIADLVDTAVRSGCHRTFDEAVGVVHEDLDPDRPCASGCGSVPAVVRGFAEEERGSAAAAASGTASITEITGP